MQRPILNPGINPDDPQQGPSRSVRLVIAMAWLSHACRLVWRILTYNPLKGAPVQFRNEDGTLFRRMLRGLFYRMAFVPLIAALAAVALVYTATHPPVVAAAFDPSSKGIYYDPVTLLSDDGTRVDAWLVPAIEPEQVLERKEQVLRMRRPAVVLLHDHGQSRQQVLPLIQPLHDAGFVVLALSMRGGNTSSAAVSAGGKRAGATFGIKEATDVKAAVELLRRRPFVDGTKIAVVGIGSGGNAALIAANNDKNIAAVAAISPKRDINEVLEAHLGPKQGYLSFLNPLCKWTFELAYAVDAQELNLSRYAQMIETRAVLVDDAGPLTELGAKHTREICEFLDAKLPTAAAASAR